MAIEIVLKLPWFTPSHKGVECLVAQPRNQEPTILSCFSKRPGGTPLSGRRGPRRPPTGADYPTGGPRRPLRESTLGLGSTLQRVSDDMVGRHVIEGRASKAGCIEKDDESGAQVLTSRWKGTGTDTWGAWEAPTLLNPTRSAVAREAIEERKLAETYLQCNNIAEAQRHLSQAAQLMSLVDEADMGLNAHNNVGQRGVVHKGNTAVNSSRQSNRQSSRRHSPPRH